MSGSVPFTVNFDASESSVTNGSIVQYRWICTGQSAETITTTPYFTCTFNNAGTTYGVRLRTRTGTGLTAREGEVSVGVYPGGTQTNASYQPQMLVGPPREVLVGQSVAFSGSRSNTPNPGETIANYHFGFGDYANCPGCSADGLTTSYAYNYASSYIASLQTTTNAGKVSNTGYQQLYAVNAGHAPHVVGRFNRVSGPAPLSISANCSESYDYDGAIMENGFGWSFGDGSPAANGPAISHTYTAPGVYNLVCVVHDNDNNQSNLVQLITVTPAAMAEKLKKRDAPPSDASREYQRQVLANACFTSNEAEACYQLGQMYEEDGDQYTKSKLWERACGMGYEAACTSR